MAARIGVFLPNWVGDVVMATPALRALHDRFGHECQLIGIMRPYVADVLAGTTWLDETITYDRGSKRDLARLVRVLRARQLDTTVLFSNSLTTAIISRLSGAPRRIGHAMHGRGWLLTHRPPSESRRGRRMPHSAVDHYLDVVGVLGCAATTRRPQLGMLRHESAAAVAIWQHFDWPDDQPVVVLNTGGAYGAAKTWPAEHFAELARRLIAARNVRVLFLCGPSEQATVYDICCQVDDPRVRSLADEQLSNGQLSNGQLSNGQLSIGLSKACVQRARAMVTTDSGPRHFAAAFDVPVVTLFGPTDPRWSENYHDASINFQLDIPCVPCSQRTCPPGHHRCMRDLTVNRVLAATTSLLDGSIPNVA